MSETPPGRTADWPFPAARLPIYYGWVVWAVSTLGFLMSVPGQTMGMAMFTDAFIEEFGLRRTELSTAYLIGTVASSFLLTSAGRLYDRLGARTMLVGSSVALGLVVAAISGIDLAARELGMLLGVGTGAIAFPLITLGYFGVRFAGQGVLTNASRNVLLVWFRKRLGFVSSLRGVFVSLGFSLAPLAIAGLMVLHGWRGALWVMAGVVGIGFALLALVLTRNRPEDIGVRVDGAAPDASHADEPVRESATLAEARASGFFWLVALSLGIHALYGTAVVFHIVSLFAEAGLSKAQALAYFLPSAAVSVTTNLIAGYLSDRLSLKPLLLVMLSAFALATAGLLMLHRPSGFYMLVLGFGMGGGLWGVLSNLAFIRVFGPLHLGAISGLNQAVTVFASAIGPILFALAYDNFGGYHAAEWLCGAAILMLLVWAALVPARGKAPVAG